MPKILGRSDAESLIGPKALGREKVVASVISKWKT